MSTSVLFTVVFKQTTVANNNGKNKGARTCGRLRKKTKRNLKSEFWFLLGEIIILKVGQLDGWLVG